MASAREIVVTVSPSFVGILAFFSAVERRIGAVAREGRFSLRFRPHAAQASGHVSWRVDSGDMHGSAADEARETALVDRTAVAVEAALRDELSALSR